MSGRAVNKRDPAAFPAGAMGRAVMNGVLAIAGLALLCNVGALAVPLFNMQVFNRVLPTRDLGTLGAMAVGLCIAASAFAVLDLLRGIAQEHLAARAAHRLAAPVLRAASCSKRPDIAAAQALSDLDVLRSFITSRACLAPFDIAWTPVLLLALVAMHWALGLLGFGCVLLLITLNIAGDMLSRQAILAANSASVDAMGSAADGVNAAEAVVGLGMVPTLAARWRASQNTAGRLVQRALLRARGISAVTNALRAGMTGGMVALGLYLALSGLASSGSMVAANMILARLLMPFAAIAGSRRQWLDVLAASRRLRAALSETVPHRLSAALPVRDARVAVENLSYLPSGAERPILRGVTFSVEAGEAVAVVGPSSSGKSTLVRMLLGMDPPTAGGVFLDGNSTYLWDREDFARHVGFLPQRAQLVDESVAENIARMQRPDLAAVVEAAKTVGLHRVIAALPNGYETTISGNMLSGGQRQRLALARALYGRPRVLLLDEPTAFLDDAGEADVVRLLERLKRQGTTVLVVTHRPALLRSMDKVLVLRDGTVAQFGPAAELVEQLVHRPVRVVRAANDQSLQA